MIQMIQFVSCIRSIGTGGMKPNFIEVSINDIGKETSAIMPNIHQAERPISWKRLKVIDILGMRKKIPRTMLSPRRKGFEASSNGTRILNGVEIKAIKSTQHQNVVREVRPLKVA